MCSTVPFDFRWWKDIFVVHLIIIIISEYPPFPLLSYISLAVCPGWLCIYILSSVAYTSRWCWDFVSLIDVQSMVCTNDMMTSSIGNNFRVTGPLCGEFTGQGEFPAQRPVTRNFDVFFDLCLNRRLCKQSWGWWFETPSRPFDIIVMIWYIMVCGPCSFVSILHLLIIIM